MSTSTTCSQTDKMLHTLLCLLLFLAVAVDTRSVDLRTRSCAEAQ